jgi:methyl-accepting chemotaxis protein
MNLQTKIIILLLFSIFTLAGISSTQLLSMNNVAKKALADATHDYKDVVKIQQISTIFKTEVQAWKNILIRGQDKKALDKYSNELNEVAEKIQTQAQSLKADLSSEDQKLIDEFLVAQSIQLLQKAPPKALPHLSKQRPRLKS